MSVDVNYIREQFPSLDLEAGGRTAAFFDGPAGTQVPGQVIDAMEDYLIEKNANKGGAFLTSRRTDKLIRSARRAMADFVNGRWQEIAFGENMTTLNYRLAFALGRRLEQGDEILITRMDHEANRQPWLDLKEKGIEIRQVEVNRENCTLDLEDFERKLNEKTAVAAFTHASNAVGTIPPVQEMVKMSREAGAITVVDAVHYAPHGLIDVQKLNCDFLLCSSYKFFGPHLGILYGRRETFEKIDPYRLRPQSDAVPFRIERGTKNHEGIAGARAAVNFIASLGEKFGSAGEQDNFPADEKSERRKQIADAMKILDDYENELAEELVRELENLPEVTVYRPPADVPCTSTVSFTAEGIPAPEMAEKLGERGIFVWAGDFYATTLVEDLGMSDIGGLLRTGISPYNTGEEVKRLAGVVKEIVGTSTI